MRVLQFPSVEIGKVFALKKGWKYSDYRPPTTLVGPAARTLSVSANQPLELKLGYALTEHPELLAKVAKDAFVKVDSNKIEFEDSICEPLSKLVSIVDLWLNDTDITDKGVEQLAALPNICALYIDSNNMKGSSLHALRATKSLRSLSMNDNAISPINFKYFAELPPITHLSAKRCSLDDQALKYIGQIKSLEILGLTKNSNVTDEGLKNLRQLKHLHVLEISDTKVTGPGLEQLKALPLQDLEVSPLVFEASAKKLHATFPHARITSSKTGKVTPEQKVLYAPFHY